MAKRRVLSLVIDLKDHASKKLAGITKATAAFVAAGLAIAARFAKQSIDAFTVQEDALNAINAALMASNQLSEEGLRLITERASEIQQITKAGDEAIISAVSTLSLLANELDAGQLAKAEEAMVGIAATFFKGDLASAALMMGKSIGTSLNALSRYGFEIDTTGTQQEKLNEIMAQSDAFFKVAAERAKTLSGRMTQAGNAFGDFKEKVGEMLQEKTTLKAFFFELTNIAGDMATVLDGSSDDIKRAFELLGEAAANAFMAAYMEVLAKGVRFLIPDFIEEAQAKLGPGSKPGWAIGVAGGLEAFAEEGFQNASNAIDDLARLAKELNQVLDGDGEKEGEGKAGGGALETEAEKVARLKEEWEEFLEVLGKVEEQEMRFGAGRGARKAMQPIPADVPSLGGGPVTAGLELFSPSEGDLSIWGRFQEFVGDTGEAMAELTQNQEAMAEVTGGILLDAIIDFGDAWTTAVQDAIEGSKSLGEAFQAAMLGAIGAVATKLGRMYALQAAAAFAEGNFAKGGGFMAASAGMFALAGAAAAAAPSRGGGGGGASSMAGDTAGTSGGEGVIVIQGGLLDMSDHRQADALSKAISNLSGRRIIIQGQGG